MLELYQAEGCPHSTDVRATLTDLGLSYVVHNPRRPDGEVLNAQTHRELVAIGTDDADQIPFLVDHDREETLYESDAIEAYLHEHYGDGATGDGAGTAGDTGANE